MYPLSDRDVIVEENEIASASSDRATHAPLF
jgi:hypothetical protein